MGHSHWLRMRQALQERSVRIRLAQRLDPLRHIHRAAAANAEDPVAALRAEHRQPCLHLLRRRIRRKSVEMHQRHPAPRHFLLHAAARKSTATHHQRLHHTQPRQQRRHIASYSQLSRRPTIRQRQRTARTFKNHLFQNHSPLRVIHALIIPQQPNSCILSHLTPRA